MKNEENSELPKKEIDQEQVACEKSPHDQFIRTEGVSYPRSGHGALSKILRHYFGTDFVYCADLGKENCGCGNIPCTNPNLLFNKNHDFKVSIGNGCNVIPDQQYIVQYRNPVRSIISDYCIFMAANPEKDAKQYWFPFAHMKINYWNNFVDKWVINSPQNGDLLLHVPYEKLIHESEQTLIRVIQFITQQEPDLIRLKTAVDSVSLKPRNRYMNFQFFDRDFFQKLEAQTGERLKKLEIPSFEDSV